jgi:hypothetical protein
MHTDEVGERFLAQASGRSEGAQVRADHLLKITNHRSA